MKRIRHQLTRSSRNVRGRNGMIPVLVGLMLAFGAAACGSTSEGGGGGSDKADGEVKEETLQKLEKLYEGEGYSEPEGDAPTPKKNQSVWHISCGQFISICAAGSEGVEDASELVGWTSHIYDTKGEDAKAGDGILEAIAADADAITMHVGDCEQAKGPLKKAKEAGIKVVAFESLDCDETSKGDEPLFSGAVTYSLGSYKDFMTDYGTAGATAIVGKVGQGAEVIAFVSAENQALKNEVAGFKEGMKTCDSCKVHEVPFRAQDLGPTLRQKMDQALLRFPEANAVWAPYDDIITSGVGAAVLASGRDQEIRVIAGEGLNANMKLVREGKQQDGGIGLPVRWESFAAVDGLIRIFAGEDVVPSGIGIQVYDKDHNVPDDGGFVPPVDFESVYKASWGVSG